MTDERKFWTPKQIAEHLAVKATTVIRYIQTGELPGMLVSVSSTTARPQYRVLGADLAAFIRARQVQPPRRRQPLGYEEIV